MKLSKNRPPTLREFIAATNPPAVRVKPAKRVDFGCTDKSLPLIKQYLRGKIKAKLVLENIK